MSTIPGSHVPHKFDLIRAGQYIRIEQGRESSRVLSQ